MAARPPSGILLPGTPQDHSKLRWCDGHQAMRPGGGGVQLGTKRWLCFGCWKARRKAEDNRQRAAAVRTNTTSASGA